MRVTLLNLFLHHGGAELCVRNLLQGLIQRGHEARLLVGRPFHAEGEWSPYVRQLPRFLPEFLVQRILSRWLGLTDTTMLLPHWLARHHADLRGADLVHLHTINGSYLNLWMLPALAARIPLVLTLHDMWSLTGDCDHSEDCERFRAQCGACPLMTRPAGQRNSLGRMDMTHVNLSIKRRVFAQIAPDRLTVVAPSHWMAQRAAASHLGRFPCEVIPNGIDLEQFAPLEASAARRALGLPQQGTLFATVAGNWASPHKGGDQLLPLAAGLAEQQLGRLVVAGKLPEMWRADLLAAGAILLDGVQKPTTLRQLFSACDAAFLLSRNENYPTIVLEAQACGCPVIARAIGGVPEMIVAGETGWIIPQGGTPHDWLHAARQHLEVAPMRQQCRQQAERNASCGRMVDRYASLYSHLVEARQRDSRQAA